MNKRALLTLLIGNGLILTWALAERKPAVVAQLEQARNAPLHFEGASADGTETCYAETPCGKAATCPQERERALQEVARLRAALTHLKYAMQRDNKRGWVVYGNNSDTRLLVDVCNLTPVLTSDRLPTACQSTPDTNTIIGDYYKTITSALAEPPIPPQAAPAQ